MKFIPIVLGILALLFMIPGLIPCLGWLNYFNIPLAVLGFGIAYFLRSQSEENKQDSTLKIGLYLNLCAGIVGIIRLYLGSGFF